MDFSHRTYLVLEMPPSEWVDQVQKFRKKYEPWRRNLPVEVTIIGSSGIGIFAKGQDPEQAIRTIDQLAGGLDPIMLCFNRKSSFSGTNLYFFAPADPSPLLQLQKQIVASKLKFETSPFPFTPHCTIADLGDTPTKETLTELDTLVVPSWKIIIQSISFYQLRDQSCHLVHRSRFANY